MSTEMNLDAAAAQSPLAMRELKALRADRARIDWLADVNTKTGHVMLPQECIEANVESMRGAIDMAMEMENGSAKGAGS